MTKNPIVTSIKRGTLPEDGPIKASHGQAEKQECRILIVDDLRFNREYSASILQEAGFVVDNAEDGAVGLDLATRNCYDLILMDIQMPNMDGLESTRRIRSFPHCSKVPILAVTANTMDEDRKRCFEAGMNDFLPKPYLPSQLLGLVRKWLRQNSAP